MRLYFAYDSNMNRQKMANRCPGARLIGPATVKGWRFVINQRGISTMIRDSNAAVMGMMWHLSHEGALLLDEYQGVECGIYRRMPLHVDGFGDAFAYVAINSQPGIPRRGYLEQIVEAARQEHLPESYVAQIAELATLGTVGH